ncbi:hypothetical protein Hamer_G008566, partial [Homarus americanus]
MNRDFWRSPCWEDDDAPSPDIINDFSGDEEDDNYDRNEIDNPPSPPGMTNNHSCQSSREQGPGNNWGSASSPINPGGANSTINPGGASSTINPGGANSTINPGGANSTINPGGANSTINPGGAGNTIDPRSSSSSTINPGGANS